MDLSLSTWMLLFFLLSFAATMWKIYVFLPNKVLEDDDTTKEVTQELTRIMCATIKLYKGDINTKNLFTKMREHKDFNVQKFWRFNQNRLEHLLEHYFLKNKNCTSIRDIYKDIV